MSRNSVILVIGGTVYIGKFIVEAAAKAGHPTSVLVRESTLSNPAKCCDRREIPRIRFHFRRNVVEGDRGPLTWCYQLSGLMLVALQDKIVAAIRKTGNVKGFFPSEFGNDVDRTHAVDPARSGLLLLSQSGLLPHETRSLYLATVIRKRRLFTGNVVMSLSSGDQTNFEIEDSFRVEASELYSDVQVHDCG